MCVDCVKERLPDRGNTCLEGGSYLLNYDGCAQCRMKSVLGEVDVQKEENEDGEETITFKHVCKDCGHVVASHIYTFSFDEECQEYSMNCNLCGHGEDTVNILPEDLIEQEQLLLGP